MKIEVEQESWIELVRERDEYKQKVEASEKHATEIRQILSSLVDAIIESTPVKTLH